MKYINLTLKSKTVVNAATEIMFEVASRRTDGVELLRYDVFRNEDERGFEKLTAGIVRILKNMKSRGSIQFFAASENFKRGGMESQFLINKYPELFVENPEDNENSTFFYIKL